MAECYSRRSIDYRISFDNNPGPGFRHDFGIITGYKNNHEFSCQLSYDYFIASNPSSDIGRNNCLPLFIAGNESKTGISMFTGNIVIYYFKR